MAVYLSGPAGRGHQPDDHTGRPVHPYQSDQRHSTTTLALVLGLALIQMVVHFRFFLHISRRKSARNDLQLILFSTLIVILMVSGTLIILFNLRARMM